MRNTGAIRRRAGASRYYSCSRKKRYTTLQSAENGARRYEQNHPGCLPREAYLCLYSRGGVHYHYGQPIGRSHYHFYR